MSSTPSVNIARLTYLLICEAGGIAVAMSMNVPVGYGLGGGLLIAAFFIWVETLVKGFTLRGFSTATFGLGVGLLCAWLLTRIDFTRLVQTMIPDDPDLPERRNVREHAETRDRYRPLLELRIPRGGAGAAEQS